MGQMKNISNLPTDLSGKIVTVRRAKIKLVIQFDLWKDYSAWLPHSEMSDFWFNLDVLQSANVGLQIKLGEQTLLDHTFKTFQTINVEHEFDDMEAGPADLQILISNLKALPIRDDTGIFVSGMFEIKSIELQGIEIKQLLDNSLIGIDSNIRIPISQPIYSWMVSVCPSLYPEIYKKIETLY